MTQEEFLQELGIDKAVEFKNNEAVVILKDSNEYAKMYSILSNSDLLDLESEKVVINTNISTLKYTGQYYNITLSADLTRDIYKLIIEEVI